MNSNAGHIEAAAVSREWKPEDRQNVHLRDSLLGQSIHCGTLAALMASSLYKQGMPPELPRLESLDLTNPQQAQDEDRPTEARKLASMCASYSSHKGNEVRPEAGPRRTLDRPTWQQIDARQWTWKTVISCTRQVEGESMPASETRAINLALLWQTRSVVRLSKKFLHLSDGQSALIYWNKEPQGFVVALGHHCLLRTMEALGTRAGDYSLRVPLGTGYLSLPGTKTSTRHSRKERVIFEDPGLVAWAAEPSKGLTPGDSICPVPATAFRNNSAAAVHGRLENLDLRL